MRQEDALAGLGALATVAEAAMNDGEVTDREMAIIAGIGAAWLGYKMMR